MKTTEITHTSDATIVPRPKIIEMLNRHGIPWETWGKVGASRTLDDLVRYNEVDHVYIRNGSSAEFTIDVHAAIVIVKHQSGGKLLELYEDRQVAQNGCEQRREAFNGIAETSARTEEMGETAIRCMREELNMTNPLLYSMSHCLRVERRAPMPSEKWPGVMAAYHRYIFECEISNYLYRRDGYVEKEKGRTIYFKWRPFRQLVLPL